MLPSSKVTFFDVENPWCRSFSKRLSPWPRRDASAIGSLWPLWGSHLRTGWDYDLPKWWKITYMYIYIYIYIYILYVRVCVCVIYYIYIWLIIYILQYTYVCKSTCMYMVYIYTFPWKKWIRNDNNDRKPWCLATIVGVLCTKIGLVLNFGVTTV